MAETKMCSEMSHGDGWPHRCLRRATGDDGLCGQHRAGRKRREESRAESDARWAAQRAVWKIKAAQERYAHEWRERCPFGTYGPTWTCPLCARVVQQIISETQFADDVDQHQRVGHGTDWDAYTALASPVPSEAGAEDRGDG